MFSPSLVIQRQAGGERQQRGLRQREKARDAVSRKGRLVRSGELCEVQQQGVGGDLRGQKEDSKWEKARLSMEKSFQKFGWERQEQDSRGWGLGWASVWAPQDFNQSQLRRVTSVCRGATRGKVCAVY